MEIMRKEDYLELGQIYALEGKMEEAFKNLHSAILLYLEGNPPANMNKQFLEGLPPDLLSYYGLCVAMVENRVEEGIRLCQKAVEKDVLRPDYYMNLSKVYLQAKQKSKALAVLKRGLGITEKNKDLMKELKKFGIRKKPTLPFLPRGHFLNRYMGWLLHRLKQKEGKRV